jgi:hypothetical protein
MPEGNLPESRILTDYADHADLKVEWLPVHTCPSGENYLTASENVFS